MRRSVRLFTLIACGALVAWAAFPRLIAVSPAGCSPGGEATTEGQNLGAETVVKLFLTAGGKDIQVEVLEQTADAIKFRVPEDTAHGQYNLMVQTGGPTPALMEQPVRLQIADEETLAKKAEEARKRAEELAKPVEPPPAETPKAQPE